MNNVAKDVIKDCRQHTFQIKQGFKNSWERYFVFRLAFTIMIVTSVIALIALFVWLLYNHAMIAAIVIWSIIGLFVGGAACVFVYHRIDRAVKNGL